MLSNINHLDLNLLKTFDILYQERSVTRAADRLAVTQSTVSGMLKRLRESFDDTLFLRSSHGITPTPRADALAPQIADILQNARGLLTPVQFDPSQDAVSIRLCGSDYLQQTLIAALAADVLSLAPKAQVACVPRPLGPPLNPDIELERQLARGDIDLLLSTGTTALDSAPTDILYADKLICVSSYPAHPPGRHLPLDALCAYRHIVLTESGGTMKNFVDNALAQRGYTRDIVLRVPNFATLFQAMRSAPFMAFLPARLVAQQAHDLAVLTTDLALPSFDIKANWHPRQAQDPQNLWLRSRLKAVCARDAARPAPPLDDTS